MNTETITQEQIDALPECALFYSKIDYVTLVARLRLLEVTRVTVSFSGSGDSGQVEDAVAENSQGGKVDITKATMLFHEEESKFDPTARVWNAKIVSSQQPLNKVLVAVAYEALNKAGLDWYNNDGGQGELVMDFSQSPPGISLEIGINETRVENHSFNY